MKAWFRIFMVLVVAGASALIAAPVAQADTSFTVDFTNRIGIYPRSAPDMAAAKVGNALPDGGAASVACETTGTWVTNVLGESSNIWERLSDGTYLPNIFVNTHHTGRTPGMPDCGDTGTIAQGGSGSWMVGDINIGYPQNNRHLWGNCTVQDFNGGPFGWLIVDYTHGVRVVRNGMLWGWLDNGGAPGLGCAQNSEHQTTTTAGAALQDFDGGSLYWAQGMDHAKRFVQTCTWTMRWNKTNLTWAYN